MEPLHGERNWGAKESRIKGEKKSVAPGGGGTKGREQLMGTGESEAGGGEKVEGKAGGRKGRG